MNQHTIWGGGVGLDLTCASDIDGGLRPSYGWTRDRGVARLRGAPAGKWGADIRVHLPGSGAGVGDRGMSTCWGACAEERGRHQRSRGEWRWGTNIRVRLSESRAGVRARLPGSEDSVGECLSMSGADVRMQRAGGTRAAEDIDDRACGWGAGPFGWTGSRTGEQSGSRTHGRTGCKTAGRPGSRTSQVWIRSGARGVVGRDGHEA
jgi:hypothetical protein